MKILKHFTIALLGIVISMPFLLNGQVKVGTANGAITIFGTSTLHDWDMKSSQGRCEATMVMNGDKLTSVSALTFSVASETLKSSKGSMMDRIAYKALKTKESPVINFVMVSSSITAVDATTYQFKGTGNLTVAGTKKLTDLVATIKYNAADKSFTSTGVKVMKMTEYNMEPPSFAFGAMKTGDEIKITFNLKIK
jgi:hypothetical protein